MSSRLSWSSSSSRVIPAAPCLDGLVLNSSIPTRALVSPVEKWVMTLPGFAAVCWGSPRAAVFYGGLCSVLWVRLVPGFQDALALLWPLGTALPPAPTLLLLHHSYPRNHIREIRAGCSSNPCNQPLPFPKERSIKCR